MGLFETYFWLVLIFFAIGVFSFILIFVILFSPLGRPGKLWSTELPRVDSDDFVRAIAKTCNAISGSQTDSPQLLNNGDEAYPVMLEALRDAQKTINFMVYICEAGKVTDDFFDIFIQKAKAGVQVRLVFDSLGARNIPMEKVKVLRKAGGHVMFFRPASHLWKLNRLYKRNHRRAIVIDGKTAFVGGMALRDIWIGHAQDKDHWRDCMVKLSGNMAQDVQSAFTQLWADVKGEVLVGEDFYPNLRGTERDQQSTRYTENPQSVRFVSLISSPSYEMYPVGRFFWFSFAAARERIYISNPYFVPIKDIVKILASKARKGVDVRLLLPNKYNDIKLVHWASHRFYERLLRAGVKIYEYQPTMLHLKLAVVDSHWSIFGSANLDMRSMHLNKENIFGVLDQNFAGVVEKTFIEDIAQAKEIKFADWKKRSRLKRWGEEILSLFEEQY
jgi:cardiolipin synthase